MSFVLMHMFLDTVMRDSVSLFMFLSRSHTFFFRYILYWLNNISFSIWISSLRSSHRLLLSSFFCHHDILDILYNMLVACIYPITMFGVVISTQKRFINWNRERHTGLGKISTLYGLKDFFPLSCLSPLLYKCLSLAVSYMLVSQLSLLQKDYNANHYKCAARVMVSNSNRQAELVLRLCSLRSFSYMHHTEKKRLREIVPYFRRSTEGLCFWKSL